MDLKRQKQKCLIEEVANIVRKAYAITTPVYDMCQVVQGMGGVVVWDMVVGFASNGVVQRTEKRSFEIHISPEQGRERSNYAIAYALGHLFLNMGYLTNTTTWINQPAKPQNIAQERIADDFALAFLMPRAVFMKKIQEYTSSGKVNISRVARYFDVPVGMASYRGRELQIISWF